MANHNLPTVTSGYLNFVSELNGRLVDGAAAFDPAFVTVTNPPTNTVRFSSAANLWQRWNGTAWVALATTYAISISGNAATATNVAFSGLTGTVPTWNQNTTGNAATVTNGVYTVGDQTIGGDKTFTNAVDIQGLTVGRGGGNIATNTAVGSGTLDTNTTGSDNTASGVSALQDNTTGSGNTASGRSALIRNTTGSDNTASGRSALFRNTTGNSNTASGREALFNNATGNDNTATGRDALYSNTTGASNTASGRSALGNNTTGNSNTASGVDALNNNTTGSDNTASGASALSNNTTGSGNTASGQNALFSNNTGSFNTASGVDALFSNTTGNSNTASGNAALLLNTTGNGNTASGESALQGNTTGNFNTASGLQALQNNTTGNSNTASGVNALVSNTTGSGNTAVNPLNSAGTYAPVFNPTTENNRFCMGSTGVTNAYIQVAWTVVSDARDKTNFTSVPHGLEFVKGLQPIAYQFRTDRDSEETNGGVRYGFRAQDVLELEGDSPVIVDNEDADKLRMIDTALIPVLVKAIQEQQALIESLTTHLTALESKT
jgi:hypothetical protein